MKYWIFQSNQVTGPFDKEQLLRTQGFSSDSLVCPEGRKGTDMGDWQRAGVVPDLSDILARDAGGTSPKSSATALSPEPTLRDLETLGTLQEKTSAMESTLNQLQEALRERDAELSRLKGELAAKEQSFQELQSKVTELDSKVMPLANVKEELDKEEHQIQELQTQLSQTNEDLKRELAKTEEEERNSQAKLTEQERMLQELQKKLEEVSAPLPKVETPAPTFAANPPVVEPLASFGAKVESQPPKMETPAPAFSANPPVMEPLSSSAAKVEFPGPKMEAPDASFSAKPPVMEPLSSFAAKVEFPGPAADAPGVVMDLASGKAEANPVDLTQKLVSPKVDKPKPTESIFKPAPSKVVVLPSVSAPKKKGGNRIVMVLGIVAMVGAVGLYFAGRLIKPGLPETPAAAVPELNPDQQPAQPAPPPPSAETPPPPAEPPPDPSQVAVDQAKAYEIPGSPGMTLAKVLETAYPSDPKANLSSWMVERLDEDKFQVNFYTGKKDLVYQFIVRPNAKILQGNNPQSIAVLSGKPPVALQSKKKARRKLAGIGKAKKPKAKAIRRVPVKRKAKPAAMGAAVAPESAAEAPPPLPGQAGPSAEPAQAAEPVPAQQPTASDSEDQKNLDELLLPGLPKPVTKKAP